MSWEVSSLNLRKETEASFTCWMSQAGTPRSLRGWVFQVESLGNGHSLCNEKWGNPQPEEQHCTMGFPLISPLCLLMLRTAMPACGLQSIRQDSSIKANIKTYIFEGGGWILMFGKQGDDSIGQNKARGRQGLQANLLTLANSPLFCPANPTPVFQCWETTAVPKHLELDGWHFLYPFDTLPWVSAPKPCMCLYQSRLYYTLSVSILNNSNFCKRTLPSNLNFLLPFPGLVWVLSRCTTANAPQVQPLATLLYFSNSEASKSQWPV